MSQERGGISKKNDAFRRGISSFFKKFSGTSWSVSGVSFRFRFRVLTPSDGTETAVPHNSLPLAKTEQLQVNADERCGGCGTNSLIHPSAFSGRVPKCCPQDPAGRDKPERQPLRAPGRSEPPANLPAVSRSPWGAVRFRPHGHEIGGEGDEPVRTGTNIPCEYQASPARNDDHREYLI